MRQKRSDVLSIIPTLLILLYLSVFFFAGEATATGSTEGESKWTNAARVTAGAVRVDGILGEEVWRNALFTGGFIQKTPDEGKPSTRRTEVAFLYDEEALYVGARMHCDDPSEIRAILSRRDNAGISERIIVSLDTYHDLRTSYSFSVTATGVRIDYYHSEDKEHDRDFSFNPVWEARTDIDGGGWTAEMRIPFSQLRFNRAEKQVWGLNMNHWIPDGNEDTYWVHIPTTDEGWASRFGELHGIHGIRPSRRVEILPYFACDVLRSGEIDEEDPFADYTEIDWRAGADFKIGIGPNLTLDGTINPDFGQVEADSADVNLSEYETVFEEKRPFFTEGNQLLGGNGPSYYYSRRIGAQPHGDPGSDYLDSPINTTILSAGKLTGRLVNGLSIGALGAVTAREYAKTSTEIAAVETTHVGDISLIDTTRSNVRDRVKVEPLTGYGVLRLQQEVGDQNSTIGLTLTAVERDIDEGESLGTELTRSAYTGGVDWEWRFHDLEYKLEGAAGFSHVKGDSSAITQVQRASAHYFQRPDADHVTLDSSRTSLSGVCFSLEMSRVAGDHWLWEIEGGTKSPEFELNDIGVLRFADGLDLSGHIRYRETEPGPILRGYNFGLWTKSSWNYGGARANTAGELTAQATFLNYWSSLIGVWASPKSMSDHLTRGGPLMETFETWSVRYGLSGNRANEFGWELTTNYAQNTEGAWLYKFSGSASIRTGGVWEFIVKPYYQFHKHNNQYVDTYDGGRAATFGNRYIFSWIDMSTLSMQFRLNYAFSPDLTLEMYAEPFASSGEYYDYGELKAPRTSELITYGVDDGTIMTVDENGTRTVTYGNDVLTIDNNDFNVLSFRSNMVLRWEWRRGSTLFLVWQQNRASGESCGNRVGGRDLLDSFRTEGDNYFAFKVSYWLGG